MLDDLWTWSSTNDIGSRVLWLHGPAGAGKSAVAQSFCQRLQSDKRLGGAFFFKRGHPSRGNARKLIPTIAYQLALLLPDLKSNISQRMEDDPSVIDRDLSEQLRELIIQPCQRNISGGNLAIVIDGLDECEGHEVQRKILRSLESAVHQIPFPLRILIASRPEPHIREIFEGPLNRFHRPLNIRQAFEDVRKYLRDEFRRIRREHRKTMATISRPWPSRQVLGNIVDKSSGYFIYASTIIKFIDDKDCRPTERLAIIVGLIAVPDSESPYGPLDQLYTQILSGVRSTARPRLLQILGLGFAAGSPPKYLETISLTLLDIEELLELDCDDVQLALRRLHSVIQVPRHNSSKFFAHHASFLDFLKDPARSGLFHIGGPRHIDVARQMLKAFSCRYNDASLDKHAIR
ncbi:hypothetical protein B0H14DRAFT_2408663 [Mycena olivaceomarginata]|nr:hypothetical protein B0H14DRAFT_2408663 [Mycena olivaceomarginata]